MFLPVLAIHMSIAILSMLLYKLSDFIGNYGAIIDNMCVCL